MARPRLKPSGKWEIAVSHPDIPGGRKHFLFDTEADAAEYARQWKIMRMADIPPPAELTAPVLADDVLLAVIIRAWMNSGLAAPTQIIVLKKLVEEVGAVRISDVSYRWLMEYVKRLKVKNNLSPISIKHRVQALSRSIDEWLRNHPEAKFSNPAKLLPKGYSTYNEQDAKLVEAEGGEVKANLPRERRLNPGEHEKIVFALSGGLAPDRQRTLELKGGDALLTLYRLILDTGMRLREAYTLTRGQIDFDTKIIKVKSTKQWRGKVVYRYVPMKREVYDLLKDYISRRPMLPGAYIFPFMTEDPDLTLTKVSQRLSSRFKFAFEYVGIYGLNEHDLRHEATCRWLEMKDANGNWLFRIEEINKIMGWAPNSTMADRYASFRGSDLSGRLWGDSEPGVVASVF